MSTVVITGGSRGIGAAAVALFAAQGDKVFFLYEKEHEAAQKVAEKTGATAICCDVADTAAVKAAFRQIPDVDVLICNEVGRIILCSDSPTGCAHQSYYFSCNYLLKVLQQDLQ